MGSPRGVAVPWVSTYVMERGSTPAISWAARITAAVANTNLLEVDDSNLAPDCLEARRRRRNQAGLSATIGRQHVGIAAAQQRVIELVIRFAFDIACTNGVQRRADTEEFAGCVRLFPLCRRGLLAGLFAHAVPGLRRPIILALFVVKWTVKNS